MGGVVRGVVYGGVRGSVSGVVNRYCILFLLRWLSGLFLWYCPPLMKQE